MTRLSLIARLLAAPLAFFALTGLYHRGVQFTIEFPDGWGEVTTRENNIVEIKNASAGVMCNAQTNFMQTLKGSTLDYLNTRYSQVFTATDWGELTGIAADAVTPSKGERRPFGDAFFQVATLSIKAGALIDTDAKVRFGIYILPDRITMAACYAQASAYPAWEALFEKIVDSLRPW